MIFLVFFKNLFFLFYFSFLLASVNKKKRKLYFELKKQKTCSQAISDQAIFVGILVWHTLKTGTRCVKNLFNMESQATGSLFHKSWLCCFSIFFSQLENQSVTVFKQCWKQQLWFLSHCITHSESRHKKNRKWISNLSVHRPPKCLVLHKHRCQRAFRFFMEQSSKAWLRHSFPTYKQS